MFETTINHIRRGVNMSGSPGGNGKFPIKDQIQIFQQEWEATKLNFEGKNEWILEKCLSLTMRFAESSAFSEKKESQAQVKILETRWNELESLANQMKVEKNEEVVSLNKRLQEVQEDKTELLAKTIILEKKIENFEEEKDKLELKFQERLKDHDEKSVKSFEELEEILDDELGKHWSLSDANEVSYFK